jgi:hypothetical protein
VRFSFSLASGKSVSVPGPGSNSVGRAFKQLSQQPYKTMKLTMISLLILAGAGLASAAVIQFDLSPNGGALSSTNYTAGRDHAVGLSNPHFPALRSGHRLFHRPSPLKQIPSNHGRIAAWGCLPERLEPPPPTPSPAHPPPAASTARGCNCHCIRKACVTSDPFPGAGAGSPATRLSSVAK